MRIFPLFTLIIIMGCASPNPPAEDPAATGFRGGAGAVKLITLDPGHFHAGLVQKKMYEQVDPTVHVYAPEGDDVQQHLGRIERYNAGDNPTNWKEKVYTGPDFLERMLADDAGNVVVLSGNNGRKTEYIQAAVENGLNVLADKPMVIDPKEYDLLESTLQEAEKKGLLVYDIMTERFEITTMLQRALSQQPTLFGELVKGSVDEPAISKESVHHFSKEVSGAPLIRPAWFFDVAQQGEGIVDVATHLVDLVLWETFPDQPITTEDVDVVRARRWATILDLSQFTHVTGLKEFPDYLQPQVKDGKLEVFSNGEIDFTVRDVHGKVSVIWNYEAPPGAADTHYSGMRGTKSNLIIRQDAAQQYTPTLYVEPVGSLTEEVVQAAIADLQNQFPGIAYQRANTGFEITVPPTLRTGHEDHFGQVTEQYLQYLDEGKIPEWERTNMLTKYFVTTEAYKMSR